MESGTREKEKQKNGREKEDEVARRELGNGGRMKGQGERERIEVARGYTPYDGVGMRESAPRSARIEWRVWYVTVRRALEGERRKGWVARGRHGDGSSRTTTDGGTGPRGQGSGWGVYVCAVCVWEGAGAGGGERKGEWYGVEQEGRATGEPRERGCVGSVIDLQQGVSLARALSYSRPTLMPRLPRAHTRTRSDLPPFSLTLFLSLSLSLSVSLSLSPSLSLSLSLSAPFRPASSVRALAFLSLARSFFSPFSLVLAPFSSDSVSLPRASVRPR